MMKKNVLLRVLAMLLLAAMLAGCTSEGPAETTAPQEQVQEGENSTSENSAAESVTLADGETVAMEDAETVGQVEETKPAEPQTPIVPQPTVPQNCIVVSTAFGNLQYQDQWIEFMRVEQHAEGDNLRVTFYAEINSVRYGLFELLIGDEDGTPAGQITDSEGVRRNVYIHMMEIVETSALTDAEQNRLFAMQEDINYIIENMK